MNLLKYISGKFLTNVNIRCFHVVPVPALEDNYMYLVIHPKDKKALAVDPVNPDKLIKLLKKENTQLIAVLTTHHHADHAGGNSQISNMVPGVPIIGGDLRIENLTKKIWHNDYLHIPPFQINCLFTPCHTKGHFCYYIQSQNLSDVCFTGDTLFVGGCGRFFEGTANHMISALRLLSSLPDSTKIYCGHEYTVNNLKFALHVEPSNKILNDKLAWAIKRCNEGLPTVPSTIGDEKSYNPFLRIDESEVKKFCNSDDAVEIMSTLRSLKDNFKAM